MELTKSELEIMNVLWEAGRPLTRGEILELSSNGLDQVVIPEPTPPAEKTYGQIAPGRKSRPKLESETEALTEDRTEPETQDQAA